MNVLWIRHHRDPNASTTRFKSQGHRVRCINSWNLSAKGNKTFHCSTGFGLGFSMGIGMQNGLTLYSCSSCLGFEEDMATTWLDFGAGVLGFELVKDWLRVCRRFAGGGVCNSCFCEDVACVLRMSTG